MTRPITSGSASRPAPGTKDAFAHALFRLMGRPEWIADPRYATLSARSQNNPAILASVHVWCREQSVDEVESRLMKEGIPVARVRTPAEALEDPAVNARREVTNLTHPDLGAIPGLKTMGLPIRFHQADYGADAPAPRLGQHNEDVYGDWLGFSKEQLAEWKTAGVF